MSGQLNGRNRLAVLVLALSMSPVGLAQQTDPQTEMRVEPDYRVRVHGYFDSDALKEFGRRLRGYVELRNDLQTGLPTLKITLNPDEIEQAEKLLARRIRTARAAAKRGDLFTAPLQGQVKDMLFVEVDARTLAAIMDDNPGEFRFRLNGTYPKDQPLSTVPPNLLALLPALADDVEYRFVGRHLILRDARANVVLDTVPFAIKCRDCDDDDDDDDHHDDRSPRRGRDR